MAGRLDTRDNVVESRVSAIVEEGAVVAGVPGCKALSRLISSFRCDLAKKAGGPLLLLGAVLGLLKLLSHDFGLEDAPLRDSGLLELRSFFETGDAEGECDVVGVRGAEVPKVGFVLPLGDDGADRSACAASFIVLDDVV